MASTLRLYGPEVGVGTAIVDADVTGVTESGDVVFTPQDSNFAEFALSPDRIEELFGDGLAYDKSAVDTTDSIWGAIEDVESHYTSDDDNLDPYFKAAKELFRGGP